MLTTIAMMTMILHDDNKYMSSANDTILQYYNDIGIIKLYIINCGCITSLYYLLRLQYNDDDDNEFIFTCHLMKIKNCHITTMFHIFFSVRLIPFSVSVINRCLYT